MKSYANIILSFIPALILGIALQFFLIKADGIDTPEKAAFEFLSLYYKVDPNMEQRLCKADVMDGETNKVQRYVDSVNSEAKIRGYLPNYMTHTLFHAEKYRIKDEDSHAEVKIEARKRRFIRCPYPYVAGLFGLGKMENIEHELKVVKEDGKWKVCDFNL
ncbi:MAG: hypothetical protein JRJ44_08460 [Deltaproteobacteria bacterium]|nr:hypothetical protein [Deltaproteobacteria bacterium]